jgi:hypothetical protein
MSFEQIVVGLAMVLYAAYAMKGETAWALVWLSYATANVGLIWAAKG